jgi:hypothetical protein
VQQAHFTSIQVSGSLWTFADPDTRTLWAGSWGQRTVHSDYARQAVAYGLTTQDELASIARAWDDWAESADGDIDPFRRTH